MKTFTIGLIGLDSQNTIVIGGGRIALRKVEALLAAGAKISVISPELAPELKQLNEIGSINAFERPFRSGDLQGAFLVIAATNDPAVNQVVWEESQRVGCLINVVDCPNLSNFIMPAVLRRGDLSLAISTGGASPALARRLRERLEEQIGPEYEDLVELLAELRPELQARFKPGGPRLAAALDLVDSDLLQILKDHGYRTARGYALARLAGNQVDD